MEKDPKSLARKNSYYKPHDITAFRGYKSIWEQVIESGGYKDWAIHGEVKIEHESHMDVDGETRNQIVGLSRKTEEWLSTLYSSVAFDSNITGHSRRAKELSDFTTRVGIELYNRAFADGGFNRFLNPDLLEKKKTKSHEDIIKMIWGEGLKVSTRGQVQHLITGVKNSGVLEPASKTYRIPAQLPERAVVLH